MGKLTVKTKNKLAVLLLNIVSTLIIAIILMLVFQSSLYDALVTAVVFNIISTIMYVVNIVGDMFRFNKVDWDGDK